MVRFEGNCGKRPSGFGNLPTVLCILCTTHNSTYLVSKLLKKDCKKRRVFTKETVQERNKQNEHFSALLHQCTQETVAIINHQFAMIEGRLQNGDAFSFLKVQKIQKYHQIIQFFRGLKKGLCILHEYQTSKLLNELSNTRIPLHVSIGKFPPRVSVLVRRSLGNLVSDLML